MHHDPLAEAAAAPVKAGMVVGLGTGRAAARAIEALAARARAERLDIACVSTSEASSRLGSSLGLRILPPEDVPRIDYLFDGADEVDGRLRMIKGRGGAMTREKILARAAAHRVYLVQRDKVVERLGVKAPLPIEVMRFGFAATRALLEAAGLRGQVRAAGNGEYLTDNGHPVIDASLPPGVDLDGLRARIDDTPGVIGHGLFLSEADEVVVEESERGPISRMKRA